MKAAETYLKGNTRHENKLDATHAIRTNQKAKHAVKIT